MPGFFVEPRYLSGVAIQIAARVAALAGSGQILVSRTVKDLVTGSGLEFEDFGARDCRGIPERYQIYSRVQ